MAKREITGLPIHVYTCVSDPSRNAVAFIGNLPMKFEAATQEAVTEAANSWRNAELQKLADQKARREAKAKAPSDQLIERGE